MARPRAEPPPPLVDWGEDSLRSVLVRVPFADHGTARALCSRTRDLLRSPAFREERLESGCAEHAVVVAGGVRGGRPTAECRLLTGGRWLSIAPMSGPRFLACSVVLDGELWVLGGLDENSTLQSVEVWNPQANSWRSSPSFRQRREGMVGGVVGGSLVIASGYDCRLKQTLASAEAFSPATGWTSLPPMPHAAGFGTAVVLGGRLYVAGGERCDKLQMWDGTAWTLKADLPAARFGAASVAVDGKMWVIGGAVHGEGTTASVIIYDLR